MPPMSVCNGLSVVDIQDSDGLNMQLTPLENTLIARNILFMKIFLLPKNRWSALKDRVVNVPISSDSVENTINCFPRLPNDAGIVQEKAPVQLKRKSSFSNSHVEQFVRPQVMIQYLDKIIEAGNPHYQLVRVNREFSEGLQCLENNPDEPSLQQSTSLNGGDDPLSSEVLQNENSDGTTSMRESSNKKQ